jgi:hypothetical protein
MTIERFDEPIMNLLGKKKYWGIYDITTNKVLNPLVLINDFLIDLDLVHDWTEYCKMRFEMERKKQNDNQ